MKSIQNLLVCLGLTLMTLTTAHCAADSLNLKETETAAAPGAADPTASRTPSHYCPVRPVNANECNYCGGEWTPVSTTRYECRGW